METKGQEIVRLQDEIATRQARLQFLVLGDPRVSFQSGPPACDYGFTHEALLAILIDRMEGFQTGPYASDDNATALSAMNVALAALQKRTRARIARGVEGTHAA